MSNSPTQLREASSRVVALVVCIVAAGCGNEGRTTDGPPQPRPEDTSTYLEVDAPAGLTQPAADSAEFSVVVPAVAQGSAAVLPSLPSLQFLREFGCEACAGPELLDLVLSVTAGSGRFIAVLTRSAPYVRVWDVDSDYAAQFGAQGDGPGELRRPFGIALLGDSVLVFDNRGSGSRIEAYTTAGTHIGYASPPRPFQLGTSESYTASPSGHWTLWTNEPFGSDGQNIFRIKTGSDSATTVAVPSVLAEASGSEGSSTVAAAVSDDGTVALGYEGGYQLALMSSGGDLIASGGRTVARRVRSQEEIDSLLAQANRALAAAARGRPPPVLNEDRFRELPHFGPSALRFDGRGRLWVKTNQGRGATSFDIFGVDLDYLGSVRLEEAEIIDYHVGSNLFVASSATPSGVPVVKVWRVLDP